MPRPPFPQLSRLPPPPRYLAAWLPLLPAERRIAAGRHDLAPDRRFVLVEAQRGAQRIVAGSRAAAADGLVPGMALADARALFPDLVALPHDPAGDAALLLRLVEACERYTPSVAGEGADLILLDLMGCGAALGCTQTDAAAWVAADLTGRLARRGYRARTAAGASPDMAAALARSGCRDPLRLPVAALGLDEDATRGLCRAGLRTLADLAGRPMAPLAARFGTDLPVRLARLLGEEDRRIVPHRAAPPLHVERRFAEPMATVAPLMGVIAELAGEAAARLAEAGAGGRRFAVQLFRTDGHVARLEVASGRAIRDPAAIARLFAERLDSLADPLDPGFGYDMVRLAVPAIEPLAAAQAVLTRDPAARPDMDDLVDRLRVRFGAASLARLAPRDAHLPEWAAAAVAPEAAGAGAWPVPEPGEPPLRPLFLYDPPQRVTVIAEVPDGPPRRFAWRGRQHRVVRQEGPERIAWPWWKKPMDTPADPDAAPDTGPTRDYYRVEDADGHRFWLFRHGLYGAEAADPGWYIHGLFA